MTHCGEERRVTRYYLFAVGVSRAGAKLSLAWNATAFPDGQLTWELRTVLQSLGYDSADNVKLFKRRRLQLLRTMARTMGIELGDDFVVPIAKCVKANEAVGIDHMARYIRDEFTILTKNLLYLLVLSKKAPMQPSKLDRHSGVLRLFLERVLPPSVEVIDS